MEGGFDKAGWGETAVRRGTGKEEEESRRVEPEDSTVEASESPQS